MRTRTSARKRGTITGALIAGAVFGAAGLTVPAAAAASPPAGPYGGITEGDQDLTFTLDESGSFTDFQTRSACTIFPGVGGAPRVIVVDWVKTPPITATAGAEFDATWYLDEPLGDEVTVQYELSGLIDADGTANGTLRASHFDPTRTEGGDGPAEICVGWETTWTATAENIPAPEPEPEPTVPPTPEPVPTPEPDPTPSPEPAPTPEPDPAPAPDPEPTPDPGPPPGPAPEPEPEPDPKPSPEEQPTPDEAPAPGENPSPEETPAPSEKPTPEEEPAPGETTVPGDVPTPEEEPSDEASPLVPTGGGITTGGVAAGGAAMLLGLLTLLGVARRRA